MKRLRQLVSGGKMDGRGRNGTPSSSLPDTATIVVKMEGRSGRVVSATDCRVRGPRFESYAGGCVYHDSHCDIQPWAHVLQCLGQLSFASLRGR